MGPEAELTGGSSGSGHQAKPGEEVPQNPGKLLPVEAEGQTYNNEPASRTEMQVATRNAQTTGRTSTLAV